MKITFNQEKDPLVLTRLNQYVQDWHHQQHPDIYRAYDYELIFPWFEEILSKENIHTIVAYDEGEAIGFVLLKHVVFDKTPFNKPGFQILMIDQMSIHTDYQSKGVGTLLMKEVMSFSRVKNIERIRLKVWSDNEPAVAFYEKMGFSAFMKNMEWRE